MVMVSDPGSVTLFDGTRIGRVEAWTDDPGTFDGWLELEGETDRLMVNGANRSWAVLSVARGYLAHAARETPEERDGLLSCDPAAWKAREDRLRRGREAGEIYQGALAEHYRSNGKS